MPSHHGFTLIDTLIALVVLEVALLGLAGALGSGERLLARGRMATRAAVQGRELLARVARSDSVCGTPSGSRAFPGATRGLDARCVALVAAGHRADRAHGAGESPNRWPPWCTAHEGQRMNRGFTLVELLVSMVLLGVVTGSITAAAMSAVRSADRSRERARQEGMLREVAAVVERELGDVAPGRDVGASRRTA